MEILTKLLDNTLTVSPNGKLDSTTSGDFEEVLNKNITSDIDNLVIDCAKVDYISSKGLRVLVSAYKQMEGKSMLILNPNAAVKEVLNLSGLTKVFNIK